MTTNLPRHTHFTAVEASCKGCFGTPKSALQKVASIGGSFADELVWDMLGSIYCMAQVKLTAASPPIFTAEGTMSAKPSFRPQLTSNLISEIARSLTLPWQVRWLDMNHFDLDFERYNPSVPRFPSLICVNLVSGDPPTPDDEYSRTVTLANDGLAALQALAGRHAATVYLAYSSQDVVEDLLGLDSINFGFTPILPNTYFADVTTLPKPASSEGETKVFFDFFNSVLRLGANEYPLQSGTELCASINQRNTPDNLPGQPTEGLSLKSFFAEGKPLAEAHLIGMFFQNKQKDPQGGAI